MPKQQGSKQELLKVILMLLGLIIIGYLIMPYINDQNVQQLGIFLAPVFSGLVVASFAYGIVYVDNLNPVVTPATPFTIDPNARSPVHLCYVGAIASGVIVTLIMYVNS